MDQLPEYLTIDEVADRYRTTVATLRYWRYLGTGPQAAKSGTRLLYPAAAIRRYDAELLAQAQQEAACRGTSTGRRTA